MIFNYKRGISSFATLFSLNSNVFDIQIRKYCKLMKSILPSYLSELIH